MFKSQIISPMTLDRITLNAQTIKYPAMLKYINWVLVKVDRAQTHRAGQCIHTGGRQMVSQVIIGKAWPSTKVVTCLEEAMLPACSKPLVDFGKKCRSRQFFFYPYPTLNTFPGAVKSRWPCSPSFLYTVFYGL